MDLTSCAWVRFLKSTITSFVLDEFNWRRDSSHHLTKSSRTGRDQSHYSGETNNNRVIYTRCNGSVFIPAVIQENNNCPQSACSVLCCLLSPVATCCYKSLFMYLQVRLIEALLCQSDFNILCNVILMSLLLLSMFQLVTNNTAQCYL